ncbi:hypothetical protein K420107F6_35130 [Lactonifactor longoviformis]
MGMRRKKKYSADYPAGESRIRVKDWADRVKNYISPFFALILRRSICQTL